MKAEAGRRAEDPARVRHGRGRRVWRILGIVVLVVVLALYIGLPVGMAVAAIWPVRAAVGEPPPGFSEIAVLTQDGAKLAAWYAPPRDGTVIVLAHGAGGSRESVRSHAVMLAENGYGVLSLDLRGHGESGGRTNRLGWQGTADIRAAVDYLDGREEVDRIGGLGSSMGGEVLLGASAACPEIRAIVTDGATRRDTAELLALPSERPLVRSFVARVMYGTVRLLSRTRPPEPLLGEMKRAASTRYLLIAAGENELEVRFNRLFDDALGRRASLWVVPGVEHVGALPRYPEEYERRVIGFFGSELATAAGPPR